MLGVIFTSPLSERDSSPSPYRAGAPTPGSSSTPGYNFGLQPPSTEKKNSSPEFSCHTANNSLLVMGTMFCFFIFQSAINIFLLLANQG